MDSWPAQLSASAPEAEPSSVSIADPDHASTSSGTAYAYPMPTEPTCDQLLQTKAAATSRTRTVCRKLQLRGSIEPLCESSA
ncbi:GD13976 [Drosophila simulans]|uniref:GD13976 n=1 Tax=Drosophila simulans TaxID=7240 RepID=B4QJU6_DROSI|nr:GD13976 [Drosophila simulans]